MRIGLALLALSGCSYPVVHLESGGDWTPEQVSLLTEDVSLSPYSGDLSALADAVAEILAPVGWGVELGRGRRTIVVGGSPSDLPSVPEWAEGASSVLCGIKPTVGFVFDGELPVREMAEVVSHELGHALGLWHHGDCSGVMSSNLCGPKRVLAGPIPCDGGACPCGGTHQDAERVFLNAPW